MEAHQERVVVEKKELDEKLQKLKDFIGKPMFQTLDRAEQGRLRWQAFMMHGYSDILAERIEAFDGKSA